VRRSGSRAGFTLLEIIVALGVLAIGATAAFSLLIAGASAARRAEHEVDAALLAETMLNDVRADPSLNLDLDALPTAQSLTDQDARIPPPVNPETRYVVHDEVDPRWPDYHYDVAITPLDGPIPKEAWSFLVEVAVRWSDRGKTQDWRLATVMVRGLTQTQNPRPSPRR
jgi:prepilin-type N-terminal cleavage/methylation domain-containing protein